MMNFKVMCKVLRMHCTYWLTAYCPTYYFTHSAMDRPLHVGREGMRLVAYHILLR